MQPEDGLVGPNALGLAAKIWTWSVRRSYAPKNIIHMAPMIRKGPYGMAVKSE